MTPRNDQNGQLGDLERPVAGQRGIESDEGLVKTHSCPLGPSAPGMGSWVSSLIFSVTRAHQQKYFKASIHLDIMERAERSPHSCAWLSRLSLQPQSVSKHCCCLWALAKLE
ncbi:nodal [Sarotherodon galilaeus]